MDNSPTFTQTTFDTDALQQMTIAPDDIVHACTHTGGATGNLAPGNHDHPPTGVSTQPTRVGPLSQTVT